MISAVTRRPTLVAAMTALLGVSALLVVASAPAANASISWSAVNPPLPSNAVSGGGLTIASAWCPVDGWCVGVGNYPALTGTTYYSSGLIVSESGGTWSSAESPLPANAAVDPQAFLEAVTCTGVGSCVAVGRYLDASGATQGLVEQLSNGVWAPSEVTLPSDAVTSGTSAYARAVGGGVPDGGMVHRPGPVHPGVGRGAGVHRHRPGGELERSDRARPGSGHGIAIRPRWRARPSARA